MIWLGIAIFSAWIVYGVVDAFRHRDAVHAYPGTTEAINLAEIRKAQAQSTGQLRRGSF